MRLTRDPALLTATIGILILAQVGTVPDASAQSVPGLIVAVPDGDRPAPAPSQRAPLPSYYGVQRTSPPPAAKPTPARPPRERKAKRSAALSRTKTAPKHSGTSIVLLVNDDPITQYEVTQRARLMALRGNLKDRVKADFRRLIQQKSTNEQLRAILKRTIQENQGQPRDVILKKFEQRKKAFAVSLQKRAIASARASLAQGFQKQAVDTLVEERLKLHEAKRLKVLIDKKQLNAAISSIAQRNKMSLKQFEQHIRKLGIDFQTMRDRIRAEMSWRNVIHARFSRLISINQQDIDQVLAGQTDDKNDIKLKLHRITLSLPAELSQAALAQRLALAESLQRRFKGCQTTRKLASATPGARFEDLGPKKAETVPEPTRSLLLNAADGQMAPPATTSRGIELYVVCSRDAVHGSLKAQAKARATLRQKEFEILARRHLMDLKRDAHIERR
jgi:peptidyl-prolyl cis-trans isomerase SurA